MAYSLPKPDSWGHMWLGAKPTRGAVIFRAGKQQHGAPKQAGGFFVSRGGLEGIIFDHGFIRYFRTADEAYKGLVAAGYKG